VSCPGNIFVTYVKNIILADRPLDSKIILNDGCDMVVKKEMLDLPSLVEILDLQVMIIDNLMNPAF